METVETSVSNPGDIHGRLNRMREVLDCRPVLVEKKNPAAAYVLELEDHLRWTLEHDGLLKELSGLLRQLAHPCFNCGVKVDVKEVEV